jgi:uncharacterized protein
MEYVTFGKTGLQVSRFGMGCMRPPTVPDAESIWDADVPEFTRMMQHAVDCGVNYFDTAYVYGASEEILGKALKDGRREKVLIATKLPAHKFDDVEACLDEQLARLQTDVVDFYLLHGLGAGSWKWGKEASILESLDEMKRKGKIRYAGFSFHASVELFSEILDAYDWDMCQIELNYLDPQYQAGLTGLRHAASKSVPVVIMEPLKGGLLAGAVPDDVQQLYAESGQGWTPAEWGLRWLGNMPEVSVVLSGVSSMEQLQEDIDIFGDAAPGCLTEAQSAAIDRARELYGPRIMVRCTGCGYCQGCPEKVNIWQIFRLWNALGVGESLETQRKRYAQMMVKNGRDASQCTQCGRCEKACPQHLPIIEKLAEAHAVLGGEE